MYTGLNNLGLNGRSGLGAPSLNLNFLNGTTDSRITYSGGANGTRVDSAGNIVAAVAPRYDYNPVTLAPLGLLVEEARTNLLQRSAALATAPWFNASLTSITNNTAEVVAPDGGSTATKIVATGPGSAVAQGVTLTAAAHGGSIYLRTATGTMTFNLIIYLAGSPFTNIGTVSCLVTTQWQRFSVVTSVATAAAYNFQLNDIPAGTLYAWGAQLEAGAFPTSYIPTTSAARTRDADSAVMTGTNFSSWYNQTQGTFVCTGDLTGGSAATFPFICAATSVTPNSDAIGVLWTADSSVLRGNIYVGGGNTVNIAAGPSLAAGSAFSAALAYAVNDSSFASAGVLGTPDTSGALPTCTQLLIGGPAIFQPYLNGHIQSIRYYPQRLGNTVLQSLTT